METEKTTEKCRQLRAAWQEASTRADRNPDHADEEQAAWDELVDFVEANDLNYTEHDPREADA